MSLHDELARIADAAPVAAVPPNTWARARRSRARGQAAGVGLVVVLIALVAGLGVGLGRGPDRVPPARTLGTSAIPEHVYAVPRDRPDLRERDLATGPAAVAFMASDSTPVVVTADTGAYHLLDLPGFAGLDATSLTLGPAARPVVVSPDGTSLAWSWAEGVQSGIAITDLLTGTTRTVDLSAGFDDAGTMIAAPTGWSPDGRFLAWSGIKMASTGEGATVGDGYFGGRIGPTDQDLGIVENPGGRTTYAVSNTGQLIEVRALSFTRFEEDSSPRPPSIPITGHAARGAPIGAAFAGSRLVIARTRVRPATQLPYDPPVDPDVPLTYVLSTPHTDQEFLGLSDGSDLVTLMRVVNAGFGSEVAVTSTGRIMSRHVASVDPEVGPLSMATDLLADGAVGVARPKPEWPSPPASPLQVLGTVLVVLVVVVAGTAIVVRRRRVVAAGAALVVGAVVVGLVTWQLVDRTPAESGIGVPDRIEAIPAWLAAQGNDEEWMRSQVETDDFAIGVAAAAYSSPEGLPVVIDAATGGYHLLGLPGYVGQRLLSRDPTAREGQTLALSPDGTMLAYAYGEPGATTAETVSGIRVVDLRSGEIVDHRAPGSRPILITAIVWSSDGTYLAWRGLPQQDWTLSSRGGRSDEIAGLVEPGSTDLDLSALAIDGSITFDQERATASTGLGLPIAFEPVGSGRSLMRVGPQAGGSLTVATELAYGSDGILVRDAPRWPWSPDRWAWTIGLGLGALLLAGLVTLGVVRRRRHPADVIRTEHPSARSR